MLNFGKYKGKCLSSVLKFDKQYIKWLIKENLEYKFDEEDSQMIHFLKHPFIDIDIDTISEEELITTLKGRNLLYCAYDYCDDEGAIHYKIDSVYCYECGSISSMCSVIATNDLKEMVVKHFKENNIYYGKNKHSRTPKRLPKGYGVGLHDV